MTYDRNILSKTLRATPPPHLSCFSKNSTVCWREARFGGSRGHTWSFGGLRNDVKWGQTSVGISGPELGGYFGPKWSMHNILHVPGWIWDAFRIVWGNILGSKTDLFGHIFEGTRKTCGFRKIARRVGERLVLEVRGGILGAFGDIKTM